MRLVMGAAGTDDVGAVANPARPSTAADVTLCRSCTWCGNDADTGRFLEQHMGSNSREVTRVRKWGLPAYLTTVFNCRRSTWRRVRTFQKCHKEDDQTAVGGCPMEGQGLRA